MKKQILAQLQAIKKLSQKFNLSGQLLIEVETNDVAKFDAAIESIKEFTRYRNSFTISKRLFVQVIMA